MSTETRQPTPGDTRLLVPTAVGQADTASGKRRFLQALVVRAAAHLAAWTPFVDALIRALDDRWIPVSDGAVIALRSWDVLSGHGLLVGEATRLAHGVYDLGPLQFWLLAVPVHADPPHGVLWGSALCCMVAASLAIEATWAVANEVGAALMTGIILGMVAWIPKMAMLPDWNPWFGMMFFLASLAAGWAVISGYSRWWPVLAVTGSIAAQAHLMYAIAAALVLCAGFFTVIVDSRRSRHYRWLIAGAVTGLACWAAPLIQQFTARVGNMSRLVHALRAGTGATGFSFGLKALSAATQPPAYWWTRSLEALTLNMIVRRAAWFGFVQLAVMALALVVAIFVLRSRRAAALSALSLLTSAAALETFSGIPRWEVWRPVTDLSYLLAPMFPVGVIAWLATGYVLVLAARRVAFRLPVLARPRLPGSGPRHARQGHYPWGRTGAGLAAVVLMVLLTMRAIAPIGGALPNQSAGRRAIRAAAARIERRMSARRIALSVVAPSSGYGRQVTLGLAYALRSAGYSPEISPALAFQIAPAYYYRGNPMTRVKVIVHKHGHRTRVVTTGG